jgi:hypothetical protein
VVRFGALTVDQIGRRTFGSILTTYGRLKALADAGYLHGERVYDRVPSAYIASGAGHSRLGQISRRGTPWRRHSEYHRHVTEVVDWLLKGHVGAVQVISGL